MPSTHIALLRGINVGGKHLLPMKDLQAAFLDLGCTDVRTLIQSGNVVFTAKPRVASQLPARAEALLNERFGFAPGVFLRSRAELDSILSRNPFLPQVEDFAKLLVFFLKDKSAKQTLDDADTERFAPDLFHLSGQEVFCYFPLGVGQSKFTNNYFDKQLATLSTGRNWNTTLKLRAMMD